MCYRCQVCGKGGWVCYCTGGYMLVLTFTHTHTHKHKHTIIHTSRHTHAHASTRTNIHKLTHMHTHTLSLTHTHNHAHTGATGGHHAQGEHQAHIVPRPWGHCRTWGRAHLPGYPEPASWQRRGLLPHHRAGRDGAGVCVWV